jgi:glycosyltransferase involved in cell wall biosynthesis
MPVYNGARYVGDAVESVLAQTFTDFELVIVNDCSTDATPQILAGIGDARVVVVHNERNLGPTGAANRGLAIARGELVAHLDADDLAERERLAEQVRFLDGHPDIAAVGSWYRKIDENGRSLGERRLPVQPAALAWGLLFYSPVVHSAVMYRRAVVLEVGGYRVQYRYASDFDLWSRIAERHRLATIPKRLVDYRIVSGSLTHTYGESEREGPEIALANTTRLLRSAGRPGMTAAQHRAMYDTLYGTRPPGGSAEIVAAFEDVAVLLETFLQQPSIGSEVASTLRDDVDRRLRRRLVEWGDQLDDGDFARALAIASDRSSWLRILRTRRARRAARMIGTSRIARTLARWRD